MKCSLGISNIHEEISSYSHSLVFLYFFALITEKGFLISPYYSLELCIQMLISFLFSFVYMLSKSLIQFSVDVQGCVPSLLFDVRSNYGGGNEDDGNLLQKVLFLGGHKLYRHEGRFISWNWLK